MPEKTKPKPAEQQKTIPKEENIPAVSRSTERAQQPGLADTKTAPGQEAAKGREQLQAVLERMKQQVGTGKDATPTQGSGQKGALQDALVQLQKKVQEQGGAGGTAGKGTGSGSGTGAGHVKGIFGAGQGEYNGVIAGIIQENWQFSGQMLRSMEGLEVYVSIRIIADGTIAEIRYDKRSPSEYLNHSARKALEKSSPLPPLPKEYGSREIWVGFVFTPEGLER
ncbi:energy transducer TonB [Chlorobium limicola]